MRDRKPSAVVLSLVAGAVSAMAAISILSSSNGAKILAECLGCVITLVVVAEMSKTADSVATLATAALLATLILVPVDYLPVKAQAVSLSVDPLLLLALLALCAPSGQRIVSVWPLCAPIFTLITGAAVYLESPGPITRFFFLSFVLVAVIVYVATWRGSRSFPSVQLISRTIMWSTGAAGLLGIVEYVLRRNPIYGSYYPPAGPNDIGAVYFPGTVTFRITSTIGHPLDVAGLLSVGLLITMGVAMTSHSRYERYVGWLIASLAVIAIVMTKSRTALVLAPAFALLLVVLMTTAGGRYGSRFGRKGLLVFVLAGAAALFLTRAIWLERFTAQSSASSTQARVLGLQYVESVLPSTLPLGLGFNAAQTRLGSGGVTVGSASAEDGWAELLIDGGPLFFLSLLAMPAAGVFCAIRSRRSTLGLVRLPYGIAALLMIIEGASFNGDAVLPRSFLFMTVAVGAIALPGGVVRS